MLARLKRRLPDAGNEALPEDLLEDLLEDAGRMIRAYTRREEVPEVLEGVQVEIAAMLCNRMGMEGESSHEEGSLHRSAESLPEFVRCQLAPYRLARTVK